MTQEEQELLIPQVQKIIGFFQHISSIPTDKVEPLITPVEENLPFRADDSKTDFQNLLDQAPSLEGSYVKVPLVVSASKKE